MADKKNDDDDKKDMGGKAADLFFKSRNVIITGEINDKLAQRITTQLIALAEDSDAPINLFISSPGGHVESGDMIYDMLKFVGPKVRTIGTGWVASAGALIFVGAASQSRTNLRSSNRPFSFNRTGDTRNFDARDGGTLTDITTDIPKVDATVQAGCAGTDHGSLWAVDRIFVNSPNSRL